MATGCVCPTKLSLEEMGALSVSSLQLHSIERARVEEGAQPPSAAESFYLKSESLSCCSGSVSPLSDCGTMLLLQGVIQGRPEGTLETQCADQCDLCFRCTASN